jgi:hypothetical protein
VSGPESRAVGTGGRKPLPILANLAIGSLGGLAADAVNLPLAWMIGAMMATTAAAVAGLPLAFSRPLRTGMITILGVMLGSAFVPELLAQIGKWPFSLAALALYATPSPSKAQAALVELGRRGSSRLTISASSRPITGFITNSRMPAARALSAVMVSPKPVQMMMGRSGRIASISRAIASPLMTGIMWSVMTTLQRSGSARNAASAAAGLDIASQR